METLQTLAERNKAFSAVTPGLQLVWDSTSLGLLKTCPRKYQYAMIEGWVPRHESVHLVFGRHLHSALEKYDMLLAEGVSKHDAIRKVVRHTLEISGTKKTYAVCPSCGTLHTEDVAACRECDAAMGDNADHYCEWCPWESDDPNKNLNTLMRTVVWYIIHFENDALETVRLQNGKAAVELSFKVPLGMFTEAGEEIWAAGHFDRVARYAGDTSAAYIVDRKTTKSELSNKFFRGFTPDNQMSFYATFAQVVLGYPVRGVIIDGAQIAVSFSRFSRGSAARPPEIQEEFLAEFQQWVTIAEGFAKAKAWPKNDKSCDQYGGCHFREVCAASPSVRHAYFESDFTRRVWDPTVPRNE